MQSLVLALEALFGQGPFHNLAQLAQVKGFIKVSVDLEVDRFDGGVQGGIPCEDNDHGIGLLIVHCPGDIHAGNVRHPKIGQHQVKLLGLDGLQSLGGVHI